LLEHGERPLLTRGRHPVQRCQIGFTRL
jgi:hypothetical protein